MTSIVEGVVSNLAAKVLEAMAKAAIQKVASWRGARRELEELRNTIRFIQARVHDAEKHQEADGGKAIKEWLRRLKTVLYQADDLFDEVLTCDRQQQQKKSRMFGKVGNSLSKFVPLNSTDRNLAAEIKSIKKQLDSIKSDMSLLNLSVLTPSECEVRIKRQHDKRESASFVNTKDVIGRDNDKSNILEMLFDTKYDDTVTVIPIVGFGGLGKTTLAQLVFNDERVQKNYLTKWAYVPEKDDLILIMGKIYKSFTDKSYNDLSRDQIQRGILESIRANKYLLVLDDLWDEGIQTLQDLVKLLKSGKEGSKVLITTRSEVAARVVRTVDTPYMLGTLTDDQSWELFKMLAFKQGREENNPFTEIGKEIVKMCANVPLAIKVVGGLLQYKDSMKEWKQFRDAQRSKAQLTKDKEIMEVLKLSYDDLPPLLKQCFAYCSFLKGRRFGRDDLVYMWMAQGYFDQSNNEIGNQLFMELLMRSFFQDPKFYADGDVESCKMHDLLHDLAESVADYESVLVRGEDSLNSITDGLLHANLEADIPEVQRLFVGKRMRSLFLRRCSYDFFEEIISRLKHLRVLKVEDIGKELPNAIESLMHLRYLYINSYKLEYLPGSITSLGNLQTLNVENCSQLMELPSDFAKLTSIRHLLLPTLTDLPRKFGKLASLQVLNRFIVGENNGMDSLPALSYGGKLDIRFHKWRRNAILEAKNANLKKSDQLTSVTLWFDESITAPIDEMSEMLMNLQLPPNITNLTVQGYEGDKMPIRWLDGLTKLVSITILDCGNCKAIPQLSRLPHLKEVKLLGLDELEYIEDEDNNVCDGGYFQSLQVLKLDSLPKLMSMPPLPKLEYLVVENVEWKVIESRVTSHDEGYSLLYTSLKELEIRSVKLGSSLSISNSLCNLNKLELQGCSKLRSLRFASPNSIHKLTISKCEKLRSIEGLQHLSVLEKLYIGECDKLDLLEEEEEAGSKWQGLTSLCKLTLYDIPKLKKLPLGITCLTTLDKLQICWLDNLIEIPEEIGNLSLLRRLDIRDCPKLESLPTSLWGLTSLQSLEIVFCPDLKRRYKKPGGEDCHLIQHIPNVRILDWEHVISSLELEYKLNQRGR